MLVFIHVHVQHASEFDLWASISQWFVPFLVFIYRSKLAAIWPIMAPHSGSGYSSLTT